MNKRRITYRIAYVFGCCLLTALSCVQKHHFEELHTEVPDEIPIVSDIAMVAFQHCNYTGYSLALSEGDYNLSDLVAYGIKNNDLSSIKVADGYQVVFFDQVNFGGASIIEVSDVACLVEEGWNDRVSSLKITKIEDRY